jgi:hypothetical protein
MVKETLWLSLSKSQLTGVIKGNVVHVHTTMI